MSIDLGIKILETLQKHQAREENRRALKLVIANQSEQIAELKNIAAEVGGIRAALDSLLATDMLTAMALLERASMAQRDAAHCSADFREARILLLRVLSTSPATRTPMQIALLHRSIAMASLGVGDYVGAADELNRAVEYFTEELRPLTSELDSLRRKAHSDLKALRLEFLFTGVLPAVASSCFLSKPERLTRQSAINKQIDEIIKDLGDNPTWEMIDRAVDRLESIKGRPVKIPWGFGLRAGAAKLRRTKLAQTIATLEQLLQTTKQLRDSVTPTISTNLLQDGHLTAPHYPQTFQQDPSAA